MEILEVIARSYPAIIILAGLLGLWLGIDRTFKKREEENKAIQVISFIVGLVLFVFPVLMVMFIKEDAVYSNYTILLMIIFGMALTARPFKELPLAFTVMIVAALGLFYLVLQLQNTEYGGDIPIKIVAIVLLVVIVIIFLISFMIEQVMDTLLYILGWGPFITILSLITAAQGVMIYVLSNHYGLLSYFGFGK